jgi:hypothetical protein
MKKHPVKVGDTVRIKRQKQSMVVEKILEGDYALCRWTEGEKGAGIFRIELLSLSAYRRAKK